MNYVSNVNLPLPSPLLSLFLLHLTPLFLPLSTFPTFVPQEKCTIGNRRLVFHWKGKPLCLWQQMFVCPGSEAKGVHIAPWATVSVWGELEATPHFPVAFRIDCRNQSGNSIKLSEANK